MSIQTVSAKLTAAGVKHVVVIASTMPTKITSKQFNGFKAAMTQDWSANDNWNKMTFGIDAPIYHLLKDLSQQYGGSDGWRDLKLGEVNKMLDGEKVQGARWYPSDYVKSLFK
jgi:hypothetical protein